MPNESGVKNFACAQEQMIPLLDAKDFTKVIQGQQVRLFTLSNAGGAACQITNYGGRVVALWLPDAKGHYDDVVLGYSNIEGFLTSQEKYFGALVGRYANRIRQGQFSLSGETYTLAANDGQNHLHGGHIGYHAVVWQAQQWDQQTLVLDYLSQDGEEGYPGNLHVKVRYRLTDANELITEYWATTDCPTVVNLTQHSFFNLKGAGNGSINDHLLQIHAAYYTPMDQSMIPTGALAAVNHTPMDFRKLTAIGKRIDEPFEQLQYGAGYDHNFVLNESPKGLNYAAKVVSPTSGRVMEVYTNEPGLQFYGGNFLDHAIVGKGNRAYPRRSAFCLETQHFPDAPNHSHFPSTRLDPKDEYYSICVYRFGLA